MSEEQQLRDCYEMAYTILKPIQRPNKSVNAMKIDNEDPLALTCLMHLLHSWKYKKLTRKPMSQQSEQTAELQLRINEITNLIAGHKGVTSGEVHWPECIPALAGYVCKQTASLQKQLAELEHFKERNKLLTEAANDYVKTNESLQKQLEEHQEKLADLANTIRSKNNTLDEYEEEIERLKKLLKSVLPMAEDGYRVSIRNGAHQEFLSEDRELLSKIKQALQSPPGESEKHTTQ